MQPNHFIRRIRRYAFFSFLLPLIALNSCLFVYKFLGSIDTYKNFNWDKKITQYSIEQYKQISDGMEDRRTFTNCSKYKFNHFIHTFNNQKFFNISEIVVFPGYQVNLRDYFDNNKLKYITIEQSNLVDKGCLKNYKVIFFLLKNFPILEKILIKTKTENGFSKIKNPYLYGEVSISRTARYFPATLIFKPLIILSSIFLIIYWRSNLNLFREFKNKNILNDFSKLFFYFGILSCIFLILHASFLGLDIESKLFAKVRRLIIILFIFFEIIAQIIFTKNLFNFREKLKDYINPLVLKIKVIFVTLVLIITIVAFLILVLADPSSGFKHALEWNYFIFLLIYYLLSRLLWKA